MKYLAGVLLCCTTLVFQRTWVHAEDLGAVLPRLSSLCVYLKHRMVIHRKAHCPEPTCALANWTQPAAQSSTSQRVVLSYGHNGFGNQLYQHTLAFLLAEALGAQLYLDRVPPALCSKGTPPNTGEGSSAIDLLVPDAFKYYQLPADSPARTLCDAESFYLSDRPEDVKHNASYRDAAARNTIALLTDPAPRCIKLLGFFISLPLCREMASSLWRAPVMRWSRSNPFAPGDVAVYLRCLPRHYHFHGAQYYRRVLNQSHMSFSRVWLLLSPACPKRLDRNPRKDGPISAVLRFFLEELNATLWSWHAEDFSVEMLLDEMALLALAPKLVLPPSTWAFWAGTLSNASEIHVDSSHFAEMGSARSQFVYHNERLQLHFGRYHGDELNYALDFRETPG